MTPPDTLIAVKPTPWREMAQRASVVVVAQCCLQHALRRLSNTRACASRVTRGPDLELNVISLLHASALSAFGAWKCMLGQWDTVNEEGDTSFKLNKASFDVDRQPEGVTASKGTLVRGESRLVNDEGDEELVLLADGQRISMSVDRQESGDIEIRGKSGAGPFRLKMQARGLDNDLRLTGNLPEELSLMPLMWELYGDDSLKAPQQPFDMGTAATLGAFWQNQIR